MNFYELLRYYPLMMTCFTASGSSESCVPCTGGFYCPNVGQSEVDEVNRKSFI